MVPKTSLFVILLITLSLSLFGQEQVNDTLVPEPKTIVRLGLIWPSFQVEQTIARNKTLVFDLWTGFSYLHQSINGQSSSSFEMDPGFTIQARFYTNLEYRRDIHKTTDYYSGTYIGIPVSVFFKNAGMAGGIVGGFQKKLGESGFWNISGGVGIREYSGLTDFSPLGNLSLGFILK